VCSSGGRVPAQVDSGRCWEVIVVGPSVCMFGNCLCFAGSHGAPPRIVATTMSDVFVVHKPSSYPGRQGKF
jgi:hypothetical protein